MTTRDYPTAGLTVHWDSEVCIHSRVCASSLSAVFRPGERPWIDADAAGADEIAATIDACPSGALRYTRAEDPASPHAIGPSTTGPVAAVEPPPVTTTTVTPTQNGPLEVLGPITVLAADGTVLREGARMYLCRCGHSANKPFCDGSHARHGFTDDGLGRKPATP